MPNHVRMVFSGRLDPASFSEFVRHRAGRLELEAEIEAADRERVSVAVSGDADLIDAFEMACSLGPIDCLVLDLERGSLPLPSNTKDSVS